MRKELRRLGKLKKSDIYEMKLRSPKQVEDRLPRGVKLPPDLATSLTRSISLVEESNPKPALTAGELPADLAIGFDTE
jgi:hypothetical protein